MKYCVYIHRRKSDGQIFYVGKALVQYQRPFQSGKHRSAHWHRVVHKHGRSVEIWSYWGTNAEACAEEIRLIAFFRFVGCPLVNATAGGEGATGRKQPEKVRAILKACAQDRIGSRSHRGIPVVVNFIDGRSLSFITGREAAKHFGVTPGTFCEWVSGNCPPSLTRGVQSIIKQPRKLA